MPVRKDENGAEIDDKRKLKLLLDTIYLAFSSLSLEIEGVSKIITLLIREYFAMNDKEPKLLDESLNISEKNTSGHQLYSEQQVKSMLSSLVNQFEEKLRKQESAFNEQIRELKSEVISLKAENAALKTENVSLKAEMVKLKSEIVTLKNENTELKANNVTLKNENFLLREHLESKRSSKSSEEEKEDSFESLSFEEIDKKAKATPWRPGTGFLDTVTYFFPCREKKREIEQLKDAASRGDLCYLLEILNKKRNQYLDVNGRGMPDSICSIIDGNGDKTALILASQNSQIDCVKQLLRFGGDVNFVDRDEMTALDYAKRNQDTNMIELLKRSGARTGKDILSSFSRSDEAISMPNLQFNTN